MPFKSANRNVSISEMQLAPHLRNRSGEGGTIVSASDGSDFYGTLGEAASEGDALGIKDGAYFKASSLLEAVGIATESGIAGARIAIRDGRDYESDRYAFIPGRFVFLSDNSPNAETNIPIYSMNSALQQLGIAITETRFKIDIKAQRKMR